VNAVKGSEGEGVAPDMVLLERVPNKRHLDDRERVWIDDLKQQGQADLNAPLPKHWPARRLSKHCAPAPEQSR
jgi:hypothetical protein